MTTGIDLPLLNRHRKGPSYHLPVFALTLLLMACSGERPGFTRVDTNHSNLRQTVVSTALSMRGKPYRYGGTDPSGFDCSGLVQYSYQKAGIKLPRTTYKQYRASKAVYLSRLQPGDLVFYRITNSLVSHVGIYIGNQQFIHAPKTGKTVSVASINDPFWQTRFVGAGEVLP